MSPVASLADSVTASRSRALLLWFAAAFALLAAFSPRDLWAPDEPRYGLVARHMLEAHDFVVPRVNGMPYPEKPPVAFWAMAGAGALLGGVTAAAARVGCALLAAAAVLTLARLARRWFQDRDLGDTAGILFATTGLVLWNSSRVALDLPMTLFSLLALEAGTVFVTSRTAFAAVGAWGTFASRAEVERAAVVGGLGLGIVWVVLALTVMPTIGRQKSFAGAAAVAARERPGAPLFEAGFTDPSVLWWFRRDRLTLLGNAGYAATARALAWDAPPAVVLVRAKFWDARARRATPEALRVLDRAAVLWRDEVGGGEHLLLSNAPGP